METLRPSPFQWRLRPQIRRPKFSPEVPSAVQQINPKKFRINATLSKQAAEIPPVATPPPPRHLSTSSSDLDCASPARKRVSSSSLQYEQGYLGAVPDRRAIEGGISNVSNAMENLTNILTSKVYDVAIESPLQLAPKLSERLGVSVWLKREDLQPVFSFKLRGAYNMMAKLTKEQLEKGVICSSAGNHAQGVALSAKKLGCDAVIAMPVTTPEIKWKSVKRLGATVVLVGDSYDEAQAYAKNRAKEEGRAFIPPFDHPDVINGQGTVGMEIVRQFQAQKVQTPIHAIFVPIGGGGLIAGIAAYVKRVDPEIKIIGVEPSDANAMALSLHHGERVILDQVGGFADGVAVKEVGEETFHLCRELIDGVVLVSRDAICASIKDMFEEKRSILEPAGALALAGAEAYCKYYKLKGENVVAITSGANMNFDKLRIVTELANVGRQREAVLASVMPEMPGMFKRFCEMVGQMNITEFKYRCTSEKEAVVLYSVGLHTVGEIEELQLRMESAQMRTLNLTSSDLVKDHLRYLSTLFVARLLLSDGFTARRKLNVFDYDMQLLNQLQESKPGYIHSTASKMGGRLAVENEILCHFIFPERPGALMKFLEAFSPRWNITLFHYRAQGETGANVLVGIQVMESEMEEFHSRANSVGYDYELVTDDVHYQLLMQ